MFDSHTHILKRNAIVDLDPVDLIATNRKPSPILRKGYYYSVGIHPWNYHRVTPSSLRLLRALAAEPQILAIGECGLDTLCPHGCEYSPSIHTNRAPFSDNQTPPLSDIHYDSLSGNQDSAQQSAKAHREAFHASRSEIIQAQTTLLRYHYTLSETLRKPLILHIVKAFPEIIALKKQWRPTQPWIIHGFRGKPQLARELLAHGFHLSFGKKYNPASLARTPPSRLLHETDQT